MDSSYLMIIAVVVVLLALLFVWNRSRKSAAPKSSRNAAQPLQPPVLANNDSAAQPAAIPAVAVPPIAVPPIMATPAASAPEQAAEQAPEPAPVSEIDWQNQGTVGVAVADANALTEYEIYKQFGYYDQALETLEKHLKTPEHRTPELIVDLSGLYLQTNQIDRYADTLEKYQEFFNPDQFREAVLLGLELDPNNLELRVLAEESAGLDAATVSQHLGDDSMGEVMAAPAATSDALEFDRADPEPVSAFARQNPQSEVARPSANKTQLVHGYAKIASLNPDERLTITGFLPPSENIKLLSKSATYEVVMRQYNRAIETSSRPATLLVDALGLDYQNKQLDAFAEHLWRLYMVLGKFGRIVKEKMLGWGYTLGAHPVFDALGAYPDDQKLKQIGYEYGFLKGTGGIGQHNKPLVVEGDWQERGDLSAAEAVLQEAESHIMYGQIDSAMDSLEKGVFEFPAEAGIYSMLFDLYERSDSWARFDEFTRKVKSANLGLPEEALLSMNRLAAKHGN